MRSTGDPITAALGGRLPPDQLAERIHAGRLRPAAARPVPRLPRRASSHGDFGTTISDNRPVLNVLTHLRHRDARAGLLRADRRLPRRHPARAGWPPTSATSAPDAVLRVFAILCYATPGLLRSACCSSWSSPSGWAGSRSPGRATTATEIQLQMPAAPDRHLPDRRHPDRRPGGGRRRAAARRPARRSRSACSPPASSCGWCAPT